MKARITCRILSLYIAFIFIQSLFYKFTGSAETQYIFGILGQWSGFPWFSEYGAWMVGIAELIASILLFTRFRFLGALLAAAIMAGAIFFHLFTPLGIKMPEFNTQRQVIGNDGGLLFINACAVFICAAIICFICKKHRVSSE